MAASPTTVEDFEPEVSLDAGFGFTLGIPFFVGGVWLSVSSHHVAAAHDNTFFCIRLYTTRLVTPHTGTHRVENQAESISGASMDGPFVLFVTTKEQGLTRRNGGTQL